MALAGNVKFKSFMRLMAGLAVTLLVAFGLLTANKAGQAEEAAEKRALEEERERKALAERIEKEQALRAERDAKLKAERDAAAAAAQAERQKLEEALGDVRDVDKLLMLDWAGRSISSPKLKDITKGRPYKVNVYQDAGKSAVNRAKVDLDRDDKWDEKWTFEEGGGITRKVAPSDDEDYSTVEVWNGERWMQGNE